MTTDAAFFALIRRAANAVRDAKSLRFVPADALCVIHPDTLTQIRQQYVAGCTIGGEPICLTDEQMLGRPLFVTDEIEPGHVEYLSRDDARNRFPVSYHKHISTKG